MRALLRLRSFTRDSSVKPFRQAAISILFLALTLTTPGTLQAADTKATALGAANASSQPAAEPPASAAKASSIQGTLDPALVGLPDLPANPSTPEDFKQAISKVEARITELGGDKAPQPTTDSTGEPATDPRIAPLEALEQALQRRAALLARRRDQKDALAELQKQRATLAREGLGESPPYPITLLDQLRTERRLSQHAAEAAKRAVDFAQQQLDASADALEQREQHRRLVRDRSKQAAQAPDQQDLARQLEAARLAVLAAGQHHAAAQMQLEVARQARDLAQGRLELLSRKIDRVTGHVVFTKKALDERLQELAGREESLRKRLKTLTRASDAAEIALFAARRQLQQATTGERTQALQAQVAAREAELGAARKGTVYLRQALTGIASARTLWERRYRLLQGDEQGPLSAWLDETQNLLDRTKEETQYIQAEIATLRSMKLTLAQRLDAPDIAPEIRRALDQRKAAIDEQETRAEELLTFEDQLSRLAARLAQELEPAVQHRSLQQRLAAMQAYLQGWWGKELFVF
jgi:MscS family membrane protein